MKDYYIEEDEWIFSVFLKNTIRGKGLKLEQAGFRLEIKSFLTLGNIRHFIGFLAQPKRDLKKRKWK